MARRARENPEHTSTLVVAGVAVLIAGGALFLMYQSQQSVLNTINNTLANAAAMNGVTTVSSPTSSSGSSGSSSQ